MIRQLISNMPIGAGVWLSAMLGLSPIPAGVAMGENEIGMNVHAKDKNL